MERKHLLGGGGGSRGWKEFQAYGVPIATIVTTTLGFITLILAAVAVHHVLGLHDDIAALQPVSVVLVNGTSDCNDATSIAQRRTRAYNVRLSAAYANYIDDVSCSINNGDDDRYAARFASFTKGLDHDALGHVNTDAYALLLTAAGAAGGGSAAAWNAVPLAAGASRGLTSPVSGLAYVLQGGDPQSFSVPPAPLFASAEQAADAVEVYWMAWARDVDFADYATDAKTVAAVVEIASLTDFRGPPVDAGTLFRGTSPGCDVGPYVSQFFYQPCTMGALTVDQRILPATAGVDFMTNMTSYLQQQDAQAPLVSLTYGSTPVFVRNLRDLAVWVHNDVLYQAYLGALLCLLKLDAPLKPGVPYVVTPTNQDGFVTWGGPDLASFVTVGATAALKAAWYQKWQVHRRLRPEAFGSRIHNMKTGAYSYPIHADILNSTIVDLIYGSTGTYLLPQAYPEGSPLHPSYPAGHATVAGVCVTILKALFVEETLIASPLMPNAGDGGQTTVALSPSADLTVGGELNKLAWNVALARNGAGLHWRSDATASLLLGQQVAIKLLRDLKTTYPEAFAGFTFTDFDGNAQVVT